MGGLTICPGDLDFYRLDVACGETMAAGISFDAAAGDLDLYLLDPTGTQALDQSATEAGSETVAWDATSDLGTAYLMVVGYPKESTANTYTMEVYKEELGSCAADGEEPNNGSFAATPVTASGSLPGLTLCCDQDWFSFPAGPGEVTATVTFPAGSTVKAWFTESGSPGQTWNLACAAGKCSGVRTLPASGTLYVAVEGSYATTYALEAVVEKGSTPSGCAGHCGDKSGDCWCDDACAQYGDCCDDVCTACGYCG